MIAKALIESLSRLLNTHETLRFLAANRKTTLLHDVSDVDLANEDTKSAKKGKINAQFTSLLETEKSVWDERCVCSCCLLVCAQRLFQFAVRCPRKSCRRVS